VFLKPWRKRHLEFTPPADGYNKQAPLIDMLHAPCFGEEN
jgi:hypothetical protein